MSIAPGMLAAAASAAGASVSWADRWQVYLTLAGAAIALLGLVYVARQLKQAREQTKSERTSALFERMQSRDFLRVTSETMAYLGVDEPTHRIRRILHYEQIRSNEARLPGRDGRDGGPRANDVFHFFNFFEEMAALYNADKIDRELTRSMVRSATIAYFERAWWFMQHLREGRLVAAGAEPAGEHETTAYAEWERMARTLRGTAPPMGPDEPVVVLCVPPDDASGPVRDRHIDLSDSLSRPRSELGALEQALGVAAADGALDGTAPPPNVLCLPCWGSRAECVRMQRLARRIGALLQSEGLDALAARLA